MSEIKNAVITSTTFGRESHGILTFMIYIEGSRFGGGYPMDCPAKNNKREYSAKGLEIMTKIMDVVGVKSWEDLSGKYIRFEDNGWGKTVSKIGNITEDKWIDLDEEFNKNKTYA